MCANAFLMQFGDIDYDEAFRKVFGDERPKEVMILFLKAILGFGVDG